MDSYIQFDKKLKHNKDMDNDTKLCYTYLHDRMKLSRTNQQFFDKKKQLYYVIYPIEEMMADLNVGKNKVIDCYKKLVELGLLMKKRNFNAATQLYLPNFNQSLIFKLAKVAKLKLNKNYCIKNDFVSVVSNDARNPFEKIKESESNENKKAEVPNNTPEKPKAETKTSAFKNDQDVFNELEFKRVYSSMIEYGVPEKVVNTFHKYSNTLDDFYEFRRLLFQAKKSVVNEYQSKKDIGINYDTTKLYFEMNKTLCNDLSTNILNILLGAFNKAKRNKDRVKGLIFGAFKKLFHEHVVISYDTSNLVDIPMCDLTK